MEARLQQNIPFCISYHYSYEALQFSRSSKAQYFCYLPYPVDFRLSRRKTVIFDIGEQIIWVSNIIFKL